MPRETTRLDIDPERIRAFEDAASRAVPLFRRAPGCIRMDLLRSLEVAGLYWLPIDWRRVEDHEAFRTSRDFAEWRALVGGFFTSPPAVEHGLAAGIGFS